MSAFYILQEKLNDLLIPVASKRKSTDSAPTKLKIREDKLTGVYVSGLSKREVENADDIANILEEGNRRRTVGQTNMNEQSSRSHSIVTISLYQRKK